MTRPTANRNPGRAPRTRFASCVGVLLALAVAAFTLGACGSSSNSSSSTTATAQLSNAAYKQAYEPLNKQIIALGEHVSVAIGTAPKTSTSQIASEFHSYAQQLHGTIAELEALHAPAAYASPQERLLKSLRAAAADLQSLASAADSQQPDQAAAATRSLVHSSLQLRAAREALERATRAAQ
jgi:hypothetical protein